MITDSKVPFSVRQTSKFVLLVGVVLLVLGIAAAVGRSWTLSVILLVSGLLALGLSYCTVTVSDRGIRAAMGPMSWPCINISSSALAEVTRRPVSTLKAGGLGYRGNWTFAKRVVVSLGGSDGIYVRTTDGRQLQVSLSAGAAVRLFDRLPAGWPA